MPRSTIIDYTLVVYVSNFHHLKYRSYHILSQQLISKTSSFPQRTVCPSFIHSTHTQMYKTTTTQKIKFTLIVAEKYNVRGKQHSEL